MDEVGQEMPGAIGLTNRASEVLLNWIKNPRVDRALGRKGLLGGVRCLWTGSWRRS